MRADYLKMFFTGYLAATGFVITLFKNDMAGGGIPGNVLFGIALLIVVVFCFSGIFYILIIRLNMVLTHYARIMEKTRGHFFAYTAEFADIWSYKDIGLHPKKAAFFSISGSIPYLILFLTGCLIPAQISLGIALAQRPYNQTWRPLLITATAAAMVCCLWWLSRQGNAAIARSLS